jgi:drug/metabolite transporter (DMT)-like permease
MSLLGALLAAFCFGASSVLQAQAAQATEKSVGIDPRLLVRLARSWRFMLGTGLDCLGFASEFFALLALPLFLVQATVASSLAVTAVLATRLMREPLGPVEWTGVAAVCVGLAMLGLSAGHEGAREPHRGLQVTLAFAVIALGLASVGIARAGGPIQSVGLGLCAGLLFGVVAMAARMLTRLNPIRIVAEPSAYLLAIGGVLGFLIYTTALQRGSVTTATAAMVVGETTVPAAVGLLVLGDSARPGLLPVAILGFALAVAGALSLARFGELRPSQ